MGPRQTVTGREERVHADGTALCTPQVPLRPVIRTCDPQERESPEPNASSHLQPVSKSCKGHGGREGAASGGGKKGKPQAPERREGKEGKEGKKEGKASVLGFLRKRKELEAAH